MSRRRDPVQRRDDGRMELHDVVDWEPRTVIDLLVYYAHTALVAGFRVVLVLLAVVLLFWQLTLGGGTLLTDPIVVTFVGLSAVPALALAAYVWYADVTATPPARPLVVTFLLGLLFVAFAGVLNAVLGNALSGVFDRYGVASSIALVSFFVLVVAPVEEGVKLLAVHVYAYRTPAFDSVIRGAVYGAAAGLGFATMENAFYITQVVTEGGNPIATATEGGAIATVRALVGPGHVVYSAFAGYYLGLARFNRQYAGPIVLKGLLIAGLLHAGYNVLVSSEALYVPGYIADLFGVSEFAALFTFVVAYNGVLIVLLIHKLSQYRAVYRETHPDQRTVRSELTEFEP